MVQVPLLFDAALWVMSPQIGRTLVGDHHRVALWLAKMQKNRTGAVRWIYPPLYASMKAVGLEEVEMYSPHRHNTVAHYISTWTIMELFMAA